MDVTGDIVLTSFAGTICRNEAHVVQDHADKDVERDPKEVHDCRTHLLGHMGCTHLHHARPEEAHTYFKNAKGHQLNLPLNRDTCSVNPPCTSVPQLCLGSVIETYWMQVLSNDE